MYVGPILVFLFFNLFHDDIYSFTLNDRTYLSTYSWLLKCKSSGRFYGYYMAIAHFTKRTLECIFLHNFSKQTKSLSSLIWELAYYWIFFGIGIAYYLLHPNYQAPFWETERTKFLVYGFLVGFVFCEFMNL